MSYRLPSEAEAQLDDIWLYLARESGSVDTAIRIVQNIGVSGGIFWCMCVLAKCFHPSEEIFNRANFHESFRTVTAREAVADAHHLFGCGYAG